MALADGKRLGPYEILSPIEAGAWESYIGTLLFEERCSTNQSPPTTTLLLTLSGS